MNVVKAKSFEKDYKKLTKKIQQRIKKSLQLLAENSRHPSLRVKKTKGKIFKDYNDIFEGRITKDYRFFFLMQGDTFYLLRCGKHDEFF